MIAARTSSAAETSQEHLERAVLWSCTFHRLFGTRRGGVSMASTVGALSQDEICVALSRLTTGPSDHRRQTLIRTCCTQLLAAGYRPPETDDALFYQVARYFLSHKHTRAEIRRALRVKAQEVFGVPYQPFTRPERLEDEIDRRPHLEPGAMIQQPSKVGYDGTAFTVSKEMLLRRPLHAVEAVINPENWVFLGPFFRSTTRECTPSDWQPGRAQSWRGQFREEFVINWNAARVNSYVAHLNVDYTVTPETVRADYALQYEEDDQLDVDDGFVEASRIPGYPEWVRYRASKSVRYASSLLNMLSPAITCTFLESHASFLDCAVVDLQQQQHPAERRAKGRRPRLR